MTRVQAAAYGRECKKAKAAGLDKPELPATLDIETIAKKTKNDLKIMNHRLKVIIDQSMYILDCFETLTKDNPELSVYFHIQDTICNSLFELQETLKYL